MNTTERTGRNQHTPSSGSPGREANRQEADESAKKVARKKNERGGQKNHPHTSAGDVNRSKGKRKNKGERTARKNQGPRAPPTRGREKRRTRPATAGAGGQECPANSHAENEGLRPGRKQEGTGGKDNGDGKERSTSGEGREEKARGPAACRGGREADVPRAASQETAQKQDRKERPKPTTKAQKAKPRAERTRPGRRYKSQKHDRKRHNKQGQQE